MARVAKKDISEVLIIVSAPGSHELVGMHAGRQLGGCALRQGQRQGLGGD